MREEFKIFLEKVPALQSRIKAFLSIIYLISLILIMVIYFFILDPIAWFLPILTQTFIAIIVSMIGYVHIKRATYYRNKYGDLAYQKFFYRYMIPYLVAWYALFFHPLFIFGPKLIPFWINIPIGIILFIMFILINLHIEKAGFRMTTHGMDLYTIFPEETKIIRGKIYGYVRHPLYLALATGCFSLGFFANNYISLITAIIHLIPCIIMGKIEDKELIRRNKNVHLEYMHSTAMIFPLKRFLGFLKLLFFFK